jgi:O-methyltransferase domain/Dimerisation domain
MENTIGSAATTLRRLIIGYRLSQAISVAAQLGVVDLLKDGPQSPDELARRTGVHPPSLYRVLRLLAGEGLLAEGEDGDFHLLPLGEPLRADVPGSLRYRAIFDGAAANWRAWGELMHSVKTGEPAFNHVWHAGLYDYANQDPDFAANLNGFITAQTIAVAQAVLDAYDFSGVDTLVDVGGGHGALLASVLSAHPAMRGVLYDLPHVAAEGRSRLASAGLVERCVAVGGSFFDAVPDGGDGYVLKFVLHNWDDARCRKILANCRRVMPVHGRLLIVEAIMRPGDAADYAKYMDLMMLVATEGGRERTESEYDALLNGTDFRLTRVIPTASEVCLIEALPA